MAEIGLTVVKVIHVLAAAMWLGGGLLFLLVVSPTLRSLPLRERLQRFIELTKFGARYFPVVALVTILTGFEVARQITGTLNPLGWDDGGYPGGRILQIAFLFVLVAFVIGAANGPVQKKIRLLGQAGWTPESEAQAGKLFARLDVVNFIDSLVLAIITVLMVIANLGGF